VSAQQPRPHLITRRSMRLGVNPEPTSENERFLTLFITNAGGW
jgi:hypothetical protein